MSSNIYLNVSKTLSHSRANGPGVRAVIWVQGCTIGCDGCYSLSTHPHRKVHLVDPVELAKWVCSIEDIEGVTLSGGEPFEQSEAVAELLRYVKAIRPELSFFLFTGYEFTVLQQSTNNHVQAVLEIADMLSSGPFVAKLYEINLLWRGSSNQQLVYLSGRYSADNEPAWCSDSPVEEIYMQNQRLEYTGFKGKNGPIYNHLKKLNLNDDIAPTT
jgi:anaerobic ribonucleoside-triphosphate reductase activating protein